MKLIVGTDKGLLVYQLEDNTWKLQDIHFIGLPVGAFHQDEDKNWWLAINHKHWGSKLYKSIDQGESFKQLNAPIFDEESAHTLKSVWTINSHQGDVYIGTEPAALFKLDGDTFKEVNTLSQHPSRSDWQGGGKGSKNPFLHSILFHPTHENELMVGISCAGIFRSEDHGTTWNPSNNGLKAFFLPNSDVEVGHDPHSIRRHPRVSSVLWQQNHCGVFRSMNNGKDWQDLSDAQGHANYGFDLVIDEEEIDTAWVIPAQSDDMRMPYKGQLAVYKTTDAGKTWKPLRNGLPQEAAFDIVLRDGFDKSQEHMAFGTNNGNLYLSADKGENWKTLSQSLSAVRSVQFID